ncbi:ABC transporter ATP-binding protein [candidate division WOR-3 bacterium JGI_Cruoil_03_51_56]|uniref:ABC transporter ATP-binding protein n=1 Tax=candidate division WOR-3 bacterium JGI_Cruoil_03_51_56 TaxID=1973747 RepID=A0A235BS22_UNCW3|nr:MAG: ABC transporter ATP-binding protein [candidate division WOR-3 bacterium JGI_Cruoil_03_51_56]
MNLIEIRNLRVILNGKRILDDLNMDIWDGHVHAVVGPNGAGKSTLAATVMGLSGYRDFEGDIRFDGRSVKHLSIDERARMGMTLAWQEPARFEGLTIRDFIRAGAKDKSETNIRKALNDVGISDEYLNRAVDKTLSGGERKKIELASIMAMSPRIVLLDEPDSGIDVASLKKILACIQLLKRKGSTVILITHSMTVLKEAEHAFLLCGGRIIDKGPVEEVAGYFKNECIPCDHQNKPDKTEGTE